MAWKDRLKPASYGGVPFFVDTVTWTGGRAVKVHTFSEGSSGPSPLDRLKAKQGKDIETQASSEFPYVEDLGREVLEYTVDCYFLESSKMPDYIQARDDFLAVCHEGGSHILQLPTLDSFNALAGKIRTTFKNKEGGIERITITFYKDVKNSQPSSTIDTEREVVKKAAAVEQAIYDVITVNFSATENLDPEVPADYGVADFVVEDTQSTLETFANKMKEYASYANTIQANVNAYIQEVNGFINDLTSIITYPTQVAQNIMGMMSQMSSIFTRPIDAFNAQLDLFRTFPDQIADIVGDTLDKIQLKKNNDAIKAAVQNGTLMHMALSVKDIDFTNSSQALEVRDSLAETVAEQQEINGSSYETHEIYTTLQKLTTASSRDLTERVANLPFIDTIETVHSMPLLVIAYGRYGNAERAEELAERNEVANPLFPPNVLEVLSE